MKAGKFELKEAHILHADGSRTKLPYGTMDEAMEALKKETEEIMKADVFKNQGKPVPQHKKDEALKHVAEMMPDADQELRIWIVGKAASLIEKDMLYALLDEVEILDKGLSKLDLTGRYRLAAVLLA